MRKLLVLALAALAACSGGQAPAPAGPAENPQPATLFLPNGRLAVLGFSEGRAQEQASAICTELGRSIAERYRLEVLAGEQVQQDFFGTEAVDSPARCLADFAALLDEGIRSMERYQLAAAGERLARAQTLFSSCGAFLERNQLVALMLAVGRFWTVRNQKEQALAAFRQAVVFHPELNPAQAGLSATALEYFDEARRAVLSGNRHRLEIETRPAGAELFLDGLPLGKTPVQLELYTGLHYLRAQAPGCNTVVRALPDAVPPEKIQLRLADIERARRLGALRPELQKPRPAPEAAAFLKELCAALETDGLVLVFFEKQNQILDALVRIFAVEGLVFDPLQRFTLGGSEKAWLATARGLASLLGQLKNSHRSPPVENKAQPDAQPPTAPSVPPATPSPPPQQLEEQKEQPQEQPVKKSTKKKKSKKKKKK